jgi:hypothetical protein
VGRVYQNAGSVGQSARLGHHAISLVKEPVDGEDDGGRSDDDAPQAGGVIQTTLAYWFFRGGDLAATISETFKVLENGICQEIAT